jgi:hypothetical protein
MTFIDTIYQKLYANRHLQKRRRDVAQNSLIKGCGQRIVDFHFYVLYFPLLFLINVLSTSGITIEQMYWVKNPNSYK